jgi:hypothetical protein
LSEHLSIGEAGAKGKGVFAAAKLQAGDLVIDYQGKEEWIWDIPEDVWEFTFQVDYDRYILPEKGSFGWYLSTIEKGEEVTIDYSTNVGWDGFVMECRCGSPGCRRVIRSYRYLDPSMKARYGACVSRFLLEKAVK